MQPCGWDGGERALALVRAFAAGVAVRVVDWGRGCDSHQAGTQAEDGSSGCAAVVAADDGRPLSPDLGSRRSQPGPAATAVASASPGADAHAGDESVACGSAQRRPAAQESTVAFGGTQRAGVVETGALGQSTTPRLARLTGSTDAEDTRSDAPIGTGSGKATGDAAADDASRSRPADGPGVRVGDRNARTFSLRQTDCQLRGTGADGRLQRRSTPTGTHQQAGQRAAPVSAGGSGAGHSAQSTAVAQ